MVNRKTSRTRPKKLNRFLTRYRPHDGGKAIIYLLCKYCVEKGMKDAQHRQAVINDIQKHICAKS
jgi:hypothetical protein